MKKLTTLSQESNLSVVSIDAEKLKGGWLLTCEEKRRTWKTGGVWGNSSWSYECEYPVTEWTWIDDGKLTITMQIL